MTIEQLLQAQRDFYATGATRPLAFRRAALGRLRLEIERRQEELLEALRQDLGKVPFEGYMTELGLVLEELRYIERRLGRWMKDRRVPTALASLPARSFQSAEPYGLVLVMAPWNYPFQLSVNPLAGAVAAGNCVVLKPSAYAPATSAALGRLVQACFEPGHVAVVEGGRAENTALLEQRFDHIFFTGSVEVGKLVMEKAARHLTPVTLELGGKSPCIVDETADIALAGRRIAFGKFLNAGQTCIAPDYVLVQRSVQPALAQAIRAAVAEFFGLRPLENEDLPRIVNEKHFRRLMGLMEGQQLLMGGEADEGSLRIAPTLLAEVDPASPVMQEEIFGPILPMLAWDRLEEAVDFVNSREKPLALYLFTKDKAAQSRVLSRCSFGGGCINDTVLHQATSHMPFGGVGHSGMGGYHGRQSFETFTHWRSLVKKAPWPDLPLRYHPYTAAKWGWLRRLMG